MTEFRIADTFTDSLVRLTPEEQKRAKLTVFDLQVDPKNQGMNFHRLGRIKDKNFWSVRVSDDLRIIVHQTAESLLVCYVDHHDRAYAWAERRRLDVHPITGAAQLVEIRELVEEVIVPRFIEVTMPAPPKPKLFASIAEATLLSYGVPTDWLSEVRSADEDSILQIAEHLPAEAAEALLEIATGGVPPVPRPETPTPDPFAHPDALRRFRVMHDVDELERALNAPWEKWLVFLHPAQRRLVERNFNGPARVAGSAGTGKTIVALHRAVFLARQDPGARALLATFSESLANALHTKLRLLISNEPRLGERIEVHSLDVMAARLFERKYEESGGQPVILLGYSQGGAIIRGMLAYAAETDPTFGTTMVDSAFFFASVHEGSYVARFGVATENFLTNPVTILNSYGTSVLAYQAARWIADQANLFIDRPAIHDLDPEGQWMAWANSPARQLPPIEYYNAYGSIQVKVSACGYLVGCWDAPFGDTNLGDMVILQGNNANPYDGPRPLGGSRFSVNGSVEWEVSGIVRCNAAKLAIPVVGPAVAAAELAKVAEAAGTSPAQHMNFPDHTGSFTVSHCGTGGQVILADEVLALIRAKLGAGGYTC